MNKHIKWIYLHNQNYVHNFVNTKKCLENAFCFSDDVWLLSLVTLQWTLVSPTNGYPLLWHTASTTQSGSVLVFGGCSNNILNIEYELVCAIVCNIFSDDTQIHRNSPGGFLMKCRCMYVYNLIHSLQIK